MLLTICYIGFRMKCNTKALHLEARHALLRFFFLLILISSDSVAITLHHRGKKASFLGRQLGWTSEFNNL